MSGRISHVLYCGATLRVKKELCYNITARVVGDDGDIYAHAWAVLEGGTDGLDVSINNKKTLPVLSGSLRSNNFWKISVITCS